MITIKASIVFTVGVLLALGAAADDDTAKAPPAARASQLWSYRPVNAPAVPVVKDARWVRTPIDAFVLAKIEASKLEPSPDAARAVFIRRATLDAWGLIPTPQEVADFEHDRSKDAYEHLVDRLLASPHYGEPLARSRAVCGQRRLPERPDPGQRLALPRLRDQRLQQR
jgi:hypothetical protein